MKASDLPLPADGFMHPMSVEQQLRRTNRIAFVLWSHREQIEDTALAGRIGIAVDPDDDEAQIIFHVHHPGEREHAEQLVKRLGMDTSALQSVPSAEYVHHWWRGTLDGFRVLVRWLEPLPTPSRARSWRTASALESVSEGAGR